MFQPGPADESRHENGPEPLWNESWYLDFWNADASVGGYIRLGLYPNLGVSWFWACLVREGRPLVTVIENEAPLPSGAGLELRSSGLWADVIAQTPYEHMTVGLEAFGVAMDDPTEVYRKGWGDREALGFDLEWETEGEVFSYEITPRYEVPCRAHGEILVGRETIEFDGWGQRDHSWGVRDWWDFDWCWTSGRFDDGSPFHAFASSDLGWSTGYADKDAERAESAAVTAERGDEGLVTAAELSLVRRNETFGVAIEPLLWSPQLLTSPDGKVSRFPRALCRYTATDGRHGAGWTEFNQVQR